MIYLLGQSNNNAIPCLQVSLRWSSRETKVLPPSLSAICGSAWLNFIHSPLIGSSSEDSFRWRGWCKGCLSVFSGLAVILSLKCKFDFLTLFFLMCVTMLCWKDLIKPVFDISFWLLKQMEIILSEQAESYRRLTIGEYTFCRCMFKQNKLQFFFVYSE